MTRQDFYNAAVAGTLTVNNVAIEASFNSAKGGEWLLVTCPCLNPHTEFAFIHHQKWQTVTDTDIVSILAKANKAIGLMHKQAEVCSQLQLELWPEGTDINGALFLVAQDGTRYKAQHHRYKSADHFTLSTTTPSGEANSPANLPLSLAGKAYLPFRSFSEDACLYKGDITKLFHLTNNEFQAQMKQLASRVGRPVDEGGITYEQYNAWCDCITILPFNLARFNLPEEQQTAANRYFTSEQPIEGGLRLDGFIRGGRGFALGNTCFRGTQHSSCDALRGFFHNDALRLTYSYCEGDISLYLFTDEAAYTKERDESIAWYNEN